MDDLPKVGEKLVIVNEFGKKLLVTLHNVKNAYQTDGLRPIILGDANLQAVYKAIVKKFPDTSGLQQVQGSNVFDSNHKAVLETVGEAYECLVGAADFRDAALHVLNDCNRLVALTNELNPEVMQLFLRLLVSYVRVNLLIDLFADRKLVAAIYSKAYSTANAATEPNYGRVAKYLTEVDSPVEKMQEDLFGLSARVGQVLSVVKQNFDRAFPMTDSLFNEGPLNTIHGTISVAKPSEEGKRLGDLSKPTELTEWILFGLLVCPSELSKPSGVDILKAALQKGFMYEIFRDDLINFHQEYEQMFSAYRGNIKAAKAILSDTSGAMVTSAPGYHHERRHFLRLQLYQSYELLKEKPAIIVPKLSMILASLSMAREEILWYFRHTDKPSPKTSKIKFKDDDNKDIMITELLFLVCEIKAMVLAQKKAIVQYYLEYLGGYYKTKVQQLYEQASATQKFDDKMKLHFDTLIDTLSKVSPSNAGVDFEPLRLNWIRLQVFFSLPNSSVSSATAGNLISLLSELSARTRYIDRLEEHVENCAGLGVLYFEKANYMAAFTLSLKHVAQSKYAGSFISIARSFLANVSPYYPKEAPIIGPKTSQLLETILSEFTKRVADLLHEASLTIREFTLKSEPEIGVQAVLRDREVADRNRKSGVTTETDSSVPGAESVMRPSTEIKKLNARKQLIKNLAVAVCKEESFTYYDTAFYPRQFLLEAINNKVRTFITSAIKTESTGEEINTTFPVKRPSIALAEIESYIMATLTIESAVDIGVPTILREALLEQVDLEAARKLTKSSQADAQAAKSKVQPKKSMEVSRLISESTEAPLLFTYLKWYIEFILAQAMSGNFVYSPLRKSFVSRISSGLRIEKYTSISEMIALCRLVGPNGLKYIEERMMRFITTAVGEIKEMIMVNSDVLAAIRDNWQNEARCADLQKKLKNIDGLYTRTIAMGVIFAFRGLFAEALTHVLDTKVTHLYNCIANAHKQYPANTYGVAGYSVIDEVANWAGIFDNVDAALRNNIEVHCHDPSVDRKTWELLPYLYGVTITGLAGLDGSAFSIAIENCENNALCLALALNKLSVATMSLVTTSAEKEVIPACQKAFLEVASTSLLRLSKEKPKELDSVVLILVEFAETSKFLTLDGFDSHFPYSYIRTAYSEAFRRRGKKKGGKEDDF